ncbi:hypothetical protein BH23ACT9_BH23ACT9_22700 [soil metagenome]
MLPRMRPPPLTAPLFARCPACDQVFRATVDLRVRPLRGEAVCAWCKVLVAIAGS